MKIVLTVLLALCLMFSTITVYADEATADEATADEATLTDINNSLTAIEFTLIFMIMIHYTEKWLKYMYAGNRDSGRVG